MPDDETYRVFIKNFIESVQDGTATGLEGTAKLVPGIFDAKIIRKLVDIGTLDSAGALATGADLFRFKAIRLILYVAGVGNEAVNAALRTVVSNRIKNQLSAGEFLTVSSAAPRSIDWDITLTFTSSVQALALSKKRDELKNAFETAINDLAIGADFDRSALETSVLADNGWTGYFTIQTNTPSGDVTIEQNQKAVAGTVTITVR